MVFWQDFVLNVSSKLIGFIVAVTFAYLYRSFWALILGSLAAQIVRVFVSYVVSPYLPKPSFKASRELLSFSIWLTLSNGIKAANQRMDPLLMGYSVPQAAIGYYTVGLRLSLLPVRESLSPLRTILFPAFARMQNDPHRLRTAYLNAQGILCIIAMPIGFGFAAVAEPVVLLIMGEKWLPAVPVIEVVTIICALQMVESSQPLAMALGRTQDVFRRDLRVFLLRLPLVLIGLLIGQATAIGAVMGVVYGRSIANLINIALNLRLVKDLCDLSLGRQLLVLLRPLLASACMLGGLALVDVPSTLVPASFADVFTTGIKVCVGAVFYALGLFGLWWVAGRPIGPEHELLVLVENAVARARIAFIARTPRSSAPHRRWAPHRRSAAVRRCSASTHQRSLGSRFRLIV